MSPPGRAKNKPGPAAAALAVWAGAFVWLGWQGLVVAVVAGVVLALGALRNAGLL